MAQSQLLSASFVRSSGPASTACFRNVQVDIIQIHTSISAALDRYEWRYTRWPHLIKYAEQKREITANYGGKWQKVISTGYYIHYVCTSVLKAKVRMEWYCMYSIKYPNFKRQFSYFSKSKFTIIVYPKLKYYYILSPFPTIKRTYLDCDSQLWIFVDMVRDWCVYKFPSGLLHS